MGNTTILSALKKRYSERSTMTAVDKVLEVARGFSGSFTRTDLILCCWKRYPLDFGLKGHEFDYPDTNRVWSVVCGQRGLLGKGKIRKTNDGKFLAENPIVFVN